MMDLFYIIHDGQQNGPFDTVSMITKIKNGRLQPNDRVRREGEEHDVSANEIKVFHEYFMEIEYAPTQDNALEQTNAAAKPPAALMQRIEDFFSVRSNAIAVAVGVFLFFFILLIGRLT